MLHVPGWRAKQRESLGKLLGLSAKKILGVLRKGGSDADGKQAGVENSRLNSIAGETEFFIEIVIPNIFLEEQNFFRLT